MNTNKPILILSTVFMLLLCGCEDDARAIWKKGIKKCANNDLLGSKVLYFGPSNKHGPGTIFERFSDGGVQVSHLPSEYLSGVTGVIVEGAEFKCSSNTKTVFSMNASLDLAKLLSSPADISGKLKSAKNIQVHSDSVQWVELVTTPYKTVVNKLPIGNSVRTDLDGGHLVLSRALRVRGMSAELEFAKDVAAEVKATIPQAITGFADTGINLSAGWKSDTKLVLTSTTDFYIGGELRLYQKGGLAAEAIGDLVPDAGKLSLKRK